MGTKTTIEAWEHNESIGQVGSAFRLCCSFDVICQHVQLSEVISYLDNLH